MKLKLPKFGRLKANSNFKVRRSPKVSNVIKSNVAPKNINITKNTRNLANKLDDPSNLWAMNRNRTAPKSQLEKMQDFMGAQRTRMLDTSNIANTNVATPKGNYSTNPRQTINPSSQRTKNVFSQKDNPSVFTQNTKGYSSDIDGISDRLNKNLDKDITLPEPKPIYEKKKTSQTTSNNQTGTSANNSNVFSQNKSGNSNVFTHNNTNNSANSATDYSLLQSRLKNNLNKSAHDTISKLNNQNAGKQKKNGFIEGLEGFADKTLDWANNTFWKDLSPGARATRIGLAGAAWMGGNTLLRHMSGGDMTHNNTGEKDLAGIPLI